MNNFQIIDILIDELQRMHTENLIHIRDHGDFNDFEFRSFRCRYSQKVQGRERRINGRIHIEGDINAFSVVHYFKIKNDEFQLWFPYDDPFVRLYLQETFREWVLQAFTMPVHEREANFERYLEQRKLWYASAIVFARSYLPGIPDDVGEMISQHFP